MKSDPQMTPIGADSEGDAISAQIREEVDRVMEGTVWVDDGLPLPPWVLDGVVKFEEMFPAALWDVPARDVVAVVEVLEEIALIRSGVGPVGPNEVLIGVHSCANRPIGLVFDFPARQHGFRIAETFCGAPRREMYNGQCVEELS